MQSFHNIETRKNFDGSRTGYDATGRSWRIRGATGNYLAFANVTAQGLTNVILGCERLADVSHELQQIKEN